MPKFHVPMRQLRVVAEDVRTDDLLETQQGWARVNSVFVWDDDEDTDRLGEVVIVVDEGESATRFDNGDIVTIIPREIATQQL